MSGFKKGDLLRVLTHVPRCGPWYGNCCWPRGVRVLTTAERERLAADTYYQGLGETRLIPRYRNDRIEPGKNVIVIRARATAPRELGWGNWANGHVLVLDPGTGNELYVKRNFLEAIPASDEGEN